MTSPVTLDSRKSLAMFSKLRESFHRDGTEIQEKKPDSNPVIIPVKSI